MKEILDGGGMRIPEQEESSWFKNSAAFPEKGLREGKVLDDIKSSDCIEMIIGKTHFFQWSRMDVIPNTLLA